MRSSVALLLLLLGSGVAAAQNNPPANTVTLKKGDRIHFWGDSLTEQALTPRGWVTFAGEPVKPLARRVPIILDCDIGTDIDDTFAVALAALSPELDVRGVTTVSGDTQARALMVCRLLTAAGRRDIPVAKGKAEQPPQALRGVQEQYIRQPPAFRASQPIKQPAVDFMYEQLKAHPGEITLVAVGPLSNIAQLLTEHPDCKPWIKRLVIMGGSVRVGYNNKPPISPEFNIRADAKSAQTVFASGVPLVVAPLDATTMLKLKEPGLKKIFDAGTPFNGHVQALYQLWDQKADPILFDPVAVTLAFTDEFCKMEDLNIEVDDKGFTRIGTGKPGLGKPNARVATSIRDDDYLKWFVDRFAAVTETPVKTKVVNASKTIERKGMPKRVHVFEDYETDIEKRWWLSGKADMTNVGAGKRSNRAVLTQDFDGQSGNQSRMYSAVIFNPVPGPPMGKNPRLSFRYYLKGTDTLKVQIYSLSNNYHRFLTLTGLPQGSWQEATVDMTAARKPDGSGGPLSEGERIDDIQFYADPRAELWIDDIVLYDEAAEGEKRPFPKRILFTGWFDSGKQGKEWPGAYEIVPKKGVFWNAAKSVENADSKTPWIELGLRGDRELGAKTQLAFRYHLTGAEAMKVALVHGKSKKSVVQDVKSLMADRWSEVVLDLPGASGERVDAIQFLLPRGAELMIDDLLLYEP